MRGLIDILRGKKFAFSYCMSIESFRLPFLCKQQLLFFMSASPRDENIFFTHIFLISLTTHCCITLPYKYHRLLLAFNNACNSSIIRMFAFHEGKNVSTWKILKNEIKKNSTTSICVSINRNDDNNWKEWERILYNFSYSSPILFVLN